VTMKFSSCVVALCVASAAAFSPAKFGVSSRVRTHICMDPNQNPFASYMAT